LSGKTDSTKEEADSFVNVPTPEPHGATSQEELGEKQPGESAEEVSDDESASEGTPTRLTERTMVSLKRH